MITIPDPPANSASPPPPVFALPAFCVLGVQGFGVPRGAHLPPPPRPPLAFGVAPGAPCPPPANHLPGVGPSVPTHVLGLICVAAPSPPNPPAEPGPGWLLAA